MYTLIAICMNCPWYFRFCFNGVQPASPVSPSCHSGLIILLSQSTTKVFLKVHEVDLVVGLVRNQKAEIIGRYNFNSHLLSINHTWLNPVPPDEFQTMFLKLPVVVNILLYFG